MMVFLVLYFSDFLQNVKILDAIKKSDVLLQKITCALLLFGSLI